MASINWQKQTAQKAGAMKRHFDDEERLSVEHSNPDIDKSKSHLNYCIGCSDYSDSYQKMRSRVAEADKESPPEKITKDRKICCSLEAPCPQKIYDAGRQKEFFEKLHQVYCDFFGTENCHGSCVHLDEIHEYIDSKTGEQKMSLAHSTELVSCFAKWRDAVWERDENGKVKTELAFDKKGKPLLDKNGNQKTKNVQAKDENGDLIFRERQGINGKNFETKTQIKKLNSAVCDMVRSEFGIEYNTGEDAQRKSVEKLKAETEVAALEREQKNKEQLILYLQREAEERERQLATIDAEVENKLDVSDELSEQISAKQKELDELYDTIDALRQNAIEWEQYNDSLFMQHKHTTDAWNKRIDAAASIEKWRDNYECKTFKEHQNNCTGTKQMQLGRS